MMGLDNVLFRQLSVRMFSQSLFAFFKKVANDVWNFVMTVMHFLLVFSVGITCQGFGSCDM